MDLAQFPSENQADARAERLDRYVLAHNDAERVSGAVARFIAHRLSAEHPRWYHLHQTDGGRQLNCDLTGEQLVLDDRWRRGAASC